MKTARAFSIGLLVFFLLWLFVDTKHTTMAQESTGWQPPVMLSEGILNDVGEPVSGFRPVVIADAWGQVHAFWGGKANPRAGIMGDTIYYARWDGQSWSLVNDVIAVADAVDQHAVPRVAVDMEGWLHLVWARSGTLWYSQASVEEAAFVRAWADPVMVSDGPLPASDSLMTIETDSEGGVHIVYCLGSEGSSIVHIASNDGISWSSPTEIASGMGGRLVNASMDEHDRLHVVYLIESATNAVGVYYTRSEDKGMTWTTPLLIDGLDDRYTYGYSPHYINVIAHGDQVHIVWHGAPRSQRWHQWSADGGLTWSQPVQISPVLVYLTNSPAMAFDGEGTLHLVSVGAGIEGAGELWDTAVFHTTWRDGDWAPLELVSTEVNERADIAIGNGNTLVVVWDDRIMDDSIQGGHFSILASAKELNVVPIPLMSQPFPTPTLAPTNSNAVTPTPAMTSTPSPHVLIFDDDGGARLEGNSLAGIWVGSLLSALVVAVVVLSRRLWR